MFVLLLYFFSINTEHASPFAVTPTMCVCAGFIGLDIIASMIALLPSLGWGRVSPGIFFAGSAITGVARIGMALCQLSIFLPRNARSQTSSRVVPVEAPMDSTFYRLEATRLKACLASERKTSAEVLQIQNTKLKAALKKVIPISSFLWVCRKSDMIL